MKKTKILFVVMFLMILQGVNALNTMELTNYTLTSQSATESVIYGNKFLSVINYTIESFNKSSNDASVNCWITDSSRTIRYRNSTFSGDICTITPFTMTANTNYYFMHNGTSYPYTVAYGGIIPSFGNVINFTARWNGASDDTINPTTLLSINGYYGSLSIPLISSANCTSAGPAGDTVSPYTTADTTPTFRFETNSSANCRIASSSMNYATMGGSRNCTSGEATQNHTCTLTSQDELTLPTSYVYLTCVNSANTSLESNATLQLDITNLAQNASLQIQQGIQASVIWPNAVVYTNQKVYLRNLANSQLLTTVTNVVVSGNQRWLINYGNTSIGLFNLTPVVYSLELVNAPIEQIPRMVASFINSTKR